MSRNLPQKQQRQQQQIRQEKFNVQEEQEKLIADTTNKKNSKLKNTEGQSNSIRGVKGADTVSSGTGVVVSKLVVEKQPLNQTEQNQIKMAKSITPVASRKAAGSNWEAAMGKTVPAVDSKKKANEKESVVNKDGENVSPQATSTLTKAQRHRQKRRAAQQKYVAMDCEMVGVGLNGQDDMLARVSIVNKRGEVLLDKFVKPQETVTDYRTSVSGIRPHDIDNGEDMKKVQDEVVQILQGKILIGHGINKDLAVLHIKHPHNNIRDTAFYKPLRRLVANGRTPSLKRLSQSILGKEIQTGEHNSVEDARAVMSIYNFLAGDWEQYIRRRQQKSSK